MPSQNKPEYHAQPQHRQRATQQALDYLTVRGFYTTAYTEIVQPERIFAVTQYFRRYWVPKLKPGPAWLVVALRQRCYWNQQRDWCVVSREFLANECGASVRTVDNYLNAPQLSWFLRQKEARYRRTSDGQKQRDWSRYYLHLDEPLTPLHQTALAKLARDELAVLVAQHEAHAEATPLPTENREPVPGAPHTERAPSPLELALAVAQRLLDLGADGLWERIRACEQDPTIQKTAQNETCSRSIQALIEEVCHTATPPPALEEKPTQDDRAIQNGKHTAELQLALSRACDALYNRIIRPDKVHIATQYFRMQWLPLLGPARAWLVMDLRARCYFNQQDLELRDTCTVAGLAELAAGLGVSVSTVKTCISKPPGPTFVSKLATRRPGRGRVEMDFQVEMIEPLTPADQERYEALVTSDQKVENAGSPSEQKTDFSGSPGNQKVKSATSPPDQRAEVSASLRKKTDSTFSHQPQETESATIGGPVKRQDLQDTKILYSPSRQQKNQQYIKVLFSKDNLVVPLPAAVGLLPDVLTMLQIHGSTRTEILQKAPDITHVLAWLVDAFSHEHIEKKIGFVISMLLSEQPPPSELVAVVSLSVGDWVELALAIREIRAYDQAYISQSLTTALDIVSNRLGHLAPEQWPIGLPLPEEGRRDVREDDPGMIERVGEREDDELGPARAWWGKTLEELQLQMTKATFDTWLRGSQVLALDGDCLVIGVRQAYAVDWLQNRLLPVILRTLTRHAPRPLEVEFRTLA